MTEIALYIHQKYPQGNNGNIRTIHSLYNSICRVLLKKYPKNEYGYREAAEAYDITLYGELPYRSESPPLINIANLSHQEQDYLIAQLLHLRGSRVGQLLVQIASPDMLMNTFHTLSSAVCPHLDLEENFVDSCINAAVCCMEHNIPDVTNETAIILQDDSFNLDCILFWFVHYNFKM